MKNLLFLIILTTATSISLADPADKGENNKQLTTAEEEFVIQCKAEYTDCFATDKEKCCFPEVIIIDQNDQIFARGERKNEIIKKFVLDSDYLTEIQGTEYFRLNIITPNMTVPLFVLRK